MNKVSVIAATAAVEDLSLVDTPTPPSPIIFSSSTDTAGDTGPDSTAHGTDPSSSSAPLAATAEPRPKAWSFSSAPSEGWASILSRSPLRRRSPSLSPGPDPSSVPASVPAPAPSQPASVAARPSPSSASAAIITPATTTVPRTPEMPPATPGTVLSFRTAPSTPRILVSAVELPPDLSTPVAELPVPLPFHATAPSDGLPAELAADIAWALPPAFELPASAPVAPAAAPAVAPAVAPVVPYNPHDEENPPSAFFTPAVQGALRNGMAIAREAATAIRGANIATDADLQRLLGEAERLQTFSGTDTRTIAVLGDSGEAPGKSSLINSLLHVPNLAFTSDLGAACTSVATEYRQKTRAHTAAYTVEVEYLAREAIHDLLKELLWDYRRIYRPAFSPEETSDADYRRYERASEQAWSALSAAFGHKGRAFTAELVRDMDEDADERLLAQLTGWADEMQWPQGSDPGDHRDGFWTATAETPAACVALTRQFSRDRHWPFTKIIRVFLDAKILEAGVVLTDLPGLHDTNLARVHVTQDYLLRCDHVLLVAKIARVCTDQSLRSSLRMVLAQNIPAAWEEPGRLHFAVVCTRADDIDVAGAREELAGNGGGGDDHLRASLTHLDDVVAAARRAGDHNRAQATIEEQEQLLVEARNRHVRTALQQTYAAETGGRTLDVFCVSNKWYKTHAAAGRADLVRASGIPALRRHCQVVAADARMAEALYYLRSTLASLLASLGLWAARSLREADSGPSTSQSEGDAEAFYRTADDINRQLLKLPTDFETKLQYAFQEHILLLFVQYKAWCVHDGEHTTSGLGYVNWNAEIGCEMRTEVEKPWIDFKQEATAACQRVLDSGLSLLQALQETLRCGDASATMAASAAIAALKHGLRYTIAGIRRELRSNIGAKRLATSQASSTSYIARVMRPTYRDAAMQHGRGSDKKRHELVQGHLDDDADLFPTVSSMLASEMNGVLSTARNRLQEVVAEMTATLMADLDLALGGRLHVRRRRGARRAARQATAEMVARMRGFDATVKRLQARHQGVVDTVAANEDSV
ncbi:hypothetical protein SCUCBS95973_007099 [Sporothrix curviconia]|uniref:Dynamin family protein n=1 Tax=Sporothrix curviconia TaxID=1260050 RepID=A0ABP0CB88_9PEZI